MFIADSEFVRITIAYLDSSTNYREELAHCSLPTDWGELVLLDDVTSPARTLVCHFFRCACCVLMSLFK